MMVGAQDIYPQGRALFLGGKMHKEQGQHYAFLIQYHKIKSQIYVVYNFNYVFKNAENKIC